MITARKRRDIIGCTTCEAATINNKSDTHSCIVSYFVLRTCHYHWSLLKCGNARPVYSHHSQFDAHTLMTAHSILSPFT